MPIALGDHCDREESRARINAIFAVRRYAPHLPIISHVHYTLPQASARTRAFRTHETLCLITLKVMC